MFLNRLVRKVISNEQLYRWSSFFTNPYHRAALDEFGVDYIELTSPAASEQSRMDCEAICKLGLKVRL